MIRVIWRSVGVSYWGGEVGATTAGTRMDADSQNLAADGVVTGRVPGGMVGS